ncbi:MAG: 7-cyano-7-deazaguanine synthase QueC [Fibrobacteria bacterium]|nr:7-cyano-7-deazaguanine synthase QueC [Fibrobacteria bacterium]
MQPKTQKIFSRNALLVFSGGQDSTTCLHWALHNFKNVQAIFFNYGQRHAIEQTSAVKIAELNNIPLKIIALDFFSQIGSNALTDSTLEIESKAGELPNTFVPGRNLIFISCAASYAYSLGITDIITGVCQTDYSGYPDCRQDTISALAKVISLGLDKEVTIHTPLMQMTKAETVDLAIKLNALKSLAYSHSCYEGNYPPCGQCPACILRAKGFKEAGIPDPLLTRTTEV